MDGICRNDADRLLQAACILSSSSEVVSKGNDWERIRKQKERRSEAYNAQDQVKDGAPEAEGGNVEFMNEKAQDIHS